MEGPGKDAFKKLKILLDRMMLRRTKVGSIIASLQIISEAFFFSFNEQTISVYHHAQ